MSKPWQADHAIAHSFLPIAAHDTFRLSYATISTLTWEIARMRAIYSSAVITVYGQDIGDTHLRNEGLTGLTFILLALTSHLKGDC